MAILQRQTSEVPAPAIIPSGLPVVKALGLHGAHFKVTTQYQEFMRERIFPLVERPRTDLVKRERRALLSNTCHQTLLLIWKESEFVTVAELATVNAGKAFKAGGLNCHSLAKQMASNQHTIDAVHERVKVYVAAAQIYGLIDRRQKHRNRHVIEGTVLLHRMFVELALQPDTHPLSFTPPPCSPALNQPV